MLLFFLAKCLILEKEVFKRNIRLSLYVKSNISTIWSLLKIRSCTYVTTKWSVHRTRKIFPHFACSTFIFSTASAGLQLLQLLLQNLRSGIKTSSFLQSSRSGLSPQPLSPQSSVLVLPSSASVSSPRRLRLNCGCDLASSRTDNIYLTLQTVRDYLGKEVGVNYSCLLMHMFMHTVMNMTVCRAKVIFALCSVQVCLLVKWLSVSLQ